MASKTVRSILLILFAIALAVPGFAKGPKQDQNKAAESQDQAKTKKKAGKTEAKEVKWVRPTDPSLYAGMDTCVTCHDEKGKNHDQGPHWKTSLVKNASPAYQGCEGCHGPGKAHAEAGGDTSKIISFKSISREQATKICLDCHNQKEEQANFARSQHAANGVSCIDCHSAHKPGVKEAMLKTKAPELCYGCHQDVKPDFSKPFHHRVNEGLVSCNDCHTPHGGSRSRQLRASAGNDQVCFGCHTDKQGPFVYEHAPVKAEGCATCHTPHGSNNPRLLAKTNVNQLCLECHTPAAENAAPYAPDHGSSGSLHNQAAKYQACTSCHNAIHGSNSDPALFKF